MSIRSMEIICPPCPKCERLKSLIKQTSTYIEEQNKIKLSYDFKHSVSLADLSRYSVNAAQTPVLVINGQVEFAGGGDATALKNKLMAIHKQ